MSFNLVGSYFGDGINDGGQSAPDLMNTGKKAVLYVFKPYDNQVGDVAMRPFSYRFDDNFLAAAAEVNDLAARGTTSASSVVDNMMTKMNFSDHIAPAFAPSMVLRGHLLADKWRFILIFTESGSDLRIGNTIGSTNNSNSQMRRIYTGYFEDEPLNYRSFSKALNPNSFMVITHKTVLGSSTSHGRLGPETQLNTWASDEIVHPQLSLNLTAGYQTSGGTGGLYLMTPDNCVNSISTDDHGYSISVPGAHSDISRDRGSDYVPDILEQPAWNVAHVVRGLIGYQDEMSTRNRLSTRQSDRMFDDPVLDGGLTRNKFARHLSIPRSKTAGRFDLDVNDRISPVELDRMVEGALDVIDFDLQRPQQYETLDQMSANMTNLYSSLIASMISPLMNSAGLNEMQFEYQIANRRGQVLDDFRLFSAAANWPVPDIDLAAMVRAVQTELKMGVFDTIYRANGAFHVVVSANATGHTSVQLSLVDQGYKCHAPFEIPSFLGGLISPLLGREIDNTSNSEAIETLHNISTGSAAFGRTFNDDDRSFANYVNELDLDDKAFSLD